MVSSIPLNEDAPGAARPRLNLVINLPGAVSAGTYGAGVLDFLVEALDAFSSPAPDGEALAHEVVLTGLSGASAGAQSALIFASAIGYRFAPARSADPAASLARNPFHRHWVELNDLADYLTTRDEPVQSLLDPTNVDRVVDSVLAFGSGLVQWRRPWLADHLRLAVALTNLRGMPSRYGDGVDAREFTRHADSMRFVLSGIGSAPAAAAGVGEQLLSLPEDPGAKRSAWHATLGRACIASGAFPLFFAPRSLERATADYALPALHAMPPAEARYSFCAVDGGVLDNDPRDLAAGLCAASRMAGERTVLLAIGAPPAEPLPGSSGASGMGVFGAFFALLNVLWNEARLRPDALAPLRASEFSAEFRIAPREAVGASSLAGTGLGGFAGYFAREFRNHDFMQGRADACAALREQFSLPEDDPLFARWTSSQRLRHRVADAAGGACRLPIIPLAEPLLRAAQVPAAVAASLPDVACYRPAMRRRIRHVLRALAAQSGSPGQRLLLRLLAAPLAWVGACLLQAGLKRYFAGRTIADQ